MIKDWPVYLKDKLIIGNLDSNIGIATLWMPKESVVAGLNSNSFAVCGQLYTKRGLNPMFRNILANPKIRYIILCGLDRQGSGEALIKFFNNGIDHAFDGPGNLSGWHVSGDEEALIDKEISIEALELLRRSVEVIDMRMKPLEEISKTIAALEVKESFGESQVFDEAPIPTMDSYPTDLSVFKIRREYVGDAWIDALKTINRFGVEFSGMYGKVKAVHNLSIVIEKEDPDLPKFYDFLKFKEEGLRLYTKGFFDTDKGDEAYTYGERIYKWDGIDQNAIMVEKLKRFPYDRGALALLWQPHKDNYPPKDTDILPMGQTKGWKVPCLVMILGQCLKDDFHMTAVFRNNDIYGAWPLNAFALRSFQKDIAQKIGKNLGTLTTISHIAEIYEMDWQDSVHIVEQNDNLARTCQYETRSYYTIEIAGDDIIIRFFTPDGAKQIGEFSINGKKPKAARDLCALVLKDMLLSDLGAAADLGRQLAKAETAVKLGLKFEQDNELKFK